MRKRSLKTRAENHEELGMFDAWTLQWGAHPMGEEMPDLDDLRDKYEVHRDEILATWRTRGDWHAAREPWAHWMFERDANADWLREDITQDWIRNASDERAAANGCRFEEWRGRKVVDWIQTYCRLYEGDCAGQNLVLHDWQFEATMRLFSWVKDSEEWGRTVRRFRKAGIFIAKKNKKSPTIAAWGMYLLCGDGERGQKTYSAARDGRQAMIAHQHALEMIRLSPELGRQCKVNQSTGQIEHKATRSFYRILAGDNKDSQEGLNGSVLVDETHVVDRRLASIIKGAGISRAQPLHIEASTAGSNVDSYGKEQRDYGMAIINGEITDEHFLAIDYSAPQELSDEELEADPVKYGKMANPAWGHTIKPSEFLADYNASKISIDKLATFKMYRLNIWQRSSNPWLKTGDWDKCRQDYKEDDLAGEQCVAGLDLSKTRDMTALSLVFREWGDEESIRILAHFWLPRKYAYENKHLAPFFEWEKMGALTLTDGSVIDYGAVRSKFHAWSQKFNICKLVYDPRFAEETTQAMSDGLYGAAGTLLEEGTGIERVSFKQTVEHYTPVIEEFERLVIAGRAHHNGNPVLTWQAEHVHKKTTGMTGRGAILEKPPSGDIKKIDGVVATLMALSMLNDLVGRSAYNTKGSLAL